MKERWWWTGCKSDRRLQDVALGQEANFWRAKLRTGCKVRVRMESVGSAFKHRAPPFPGPSDGSSNPPGAPSPHLISRWSNHSPQRSKPHQIGHNLTIIPCLQPILSLFSRGTPPDILRASHSSPLTPSPLYVLCATKTGLASCCHPFNSNGSTQGLRCIQNEEKRPSACVRAAAELQ